MHLPLSKSALKISKILQENSKTFEEEHKKSGSNGAILGLAVIWMGDFLVGEWVKSPREGRGGERPHLKISKNLHENSRRRRLENFFQEFTGRFSKHFRLIYSNFNLSSLHKLSLAYFNLQLVR